MQAVLLLQVRKWQLLKSAVDQLLMKLVAKA